jgi:exopolyphosphatase/guanosine-5'-triphosphate,3'-diphosphate pyrophosphatase
VAQRCQYEKPHSEQVARLAVSLYDQFRNESDLILGLGTFRHERDILEAAAVLHDVGIMVEYTRHHRHSQTIIRHAELRWWEPREVELIAMVARYHRRSTPSDGHQDFAALTPPEQSLVRRLAALLRTADGLDRDHAQHVADVRVRFGNKGVVLEATADDDIGVDLRRRTRSPTSSGRFSEPG